MSEEMSYEFKLFLDPKKVLAEDKKPLTQINGLSFSFKENMQIYLLDTPDLQFYETGWIVRSRWKNEKWELTYKRRIRDYVNLESAIQQALDEGFELADYELEVEWGYTKKALALSRDFSIELNGNTQDKWKQLMLEKAPQPFKDNSVFKGVQDARVMGVIQSSKYKSEWNGENVQLEVWSIDEECMAEATLKIKKATEAVAKEKHLQFIKLFQLDHVLLEKDMSKTKWALEKLKNAYIQQTIH